MTQDLVLHAPSRPIVGPPAARAVVDTRRLPWLGTDPRASAVDYDPSSDYPDYRPLAFEARHQVALREVLTCNVWDALGIGVPTLWPLSIGRRRTVPLGIYMTGTSGTPHIGLHLRAIHHLQRNSEWSLEDICTTTVLHEAGHAYLECCGVSDQNHLESAVEEAAMYGWRTYDWAGMRADLDLLVT